MPATTIAICSGVAATSNWPMPDWPVCGSFISSGNRAVAWGRRSSKYCWLKPNASACSRIRSAPTSIASRAKVVLQEFSIDWAKGMRSAPQSRPSLSIRPVSPVVCGSWKDGPPGTSSPAS